jgi:hypothetical protein
MFPDVIVIGVVASSTAAEVSTGVEIITTYTLDIVTTTSFASQTGMVSTSGDNGTTRSTRLISKRNKTTPSSQPDTMTIATSNLIPSESSGFTTSDIVGIILAAAGVVIAIFFGVLGIMYARRKPRKLQRIVIGRLLLICSWVSYDDWLL